MNDNNFQLKFWNRAETGLHIFEESVLFKGSSGLGCHKTSRTFMGPASEGYIVCIYKFSIKMKKKILQNHYCILNNVKVYDSCQEMPKKLCYFFMDTKKLKFLLINWTFNLGVNSQMQNVCFSKLEISVFTENFLNKNLDPSKITICIPILIYLFEIFQNFKMQELVFENPIMSIISCCCCRSNRL